MTNQEIVAIIARKKMELIANVPEGYKIHAFISDYGAGFVAAHPMKPAMIFKDDHWEEVMIAGPSNRKYKQGREVHINHSKENDDAKET